jgi:glycosyltransferase 2 family protein
MPAQPDIDFMSLSVVFILATLLGFASHAPGSLGVFDAAMLIALPQFGREQLLATLLVFRVLYFVIPFAISISIMGTRELWLNVVVPWQQRRKGSGNGGGNCVPMTAAQSPAKPAPVAAVAQPVKRLKSKA